jgi:membrane protease YdiL (CAAX protease family)
MAPGGAEASGIVVRLQDRRRSDGGSAAGRLPEPWQPGTLTRDLVTNPAQRPPESALERFGKLTTELVLLGLSALVGISAVIALMWTGVLPDPEVAPGSTILAGPLLIGTAGMSYLTLEHTVLRDADPPRPLELSDGRERASLGKGLLIALGCLLIATAGSMVLAVAQKLLLSTEVEEQQTILELVRRGDPMELTLLGVSAVVLAPLTEELLFRHMFFRRLRQRAGIVVAWTLPALAFAIAHWNPVGLIVYVWLGSVFALAYAASGRFWVAVLVHAGHNAFALTMLLVAPEALP